ncbi:MAG: hypothetical protein JWM10_4727 [Myxococcaceae bacterium]|nr:hypothetical protein [Myxococcaceae bacterium]
MRAAALSVVAALGGALALGGCDECTDFHASRPAQLLRSGRYTLTAQQLAESSLPAVNAAGLITVTIDRDAATLQMRWTRTDGSVTEETWRMRPE